MNLLALRQSLDNSVWEMSPESFLSFKDSLTDLMKAELSTFTTSTGDDLLIPDSDGVLTVPVNGTLVKHSGLSDDVCEFLNVTDLDNLEKNLVAAADSPDVSTILLQFNSGGGTTHAHSTAQLIREIAETKDVIGYTDSMCLSAAYNLAAMCSAFYVSETTWAGFVGTIYSRPDYTQANAEDGVKYTFVTSSPKKLYLNPDTEISPEELEWIKQSVLFSYELFKGDVLSNRDIDEQFLDSNILIGEQNVEANLADGLFKNLQDLKEKLKDSPIRNYL